MEEERKRRERGNKIKGAELGEERRREPGDKWKGEKYPTTFIRPEIIPTSPSLPFSVLIFLSKCQARIPSAFFSPLCLH